VGKISSGSVEIGRFSQAGTELQLYRIDFAAAVTPVGLRSVATGITPFMIIGGFDAITLRRHLA
jgi:hypothetical protein